MFQDDKSPAVNRDTDSYWENGSGHSVDRLSLHLATVAVADFTARRAMRSPNESAL